MVSLLRKGKSALPSKSKTTHLTTRDLKGRSQKAITAVEPGVMVWDIGTYAVIDKDIAEALKTGSIHLRLNGKKLRGDWTLVRLKKAEEKKQPWLFIKSASDHKRITSKVEDQSALSHRSMAQISKANDAQWDSKKGSSTHAPDFTAALRGLPKAKPGFCRPYESSARRTASVGLRVVVRD